MPSVTRLMDDALDRIAERVSTEVSPEDHMFPKRGTQAGKMERYLGVGRSAMRNLLLAAASAELDEVHHILDFACGAGRVARWLRATFPDAELTTSDINASWVAFCADSFSATAHVSSHALHEVSFDTRFDLIWCGSLLTHLSEANAVAALDTLYGALRPGGVMLFTVHGRKMLYNRLSNESSYLHDAGFNQIVMDATFNGYGFAPHRPQGIGGISLTTPSWVAHWCQKSPERRLVYFVERGWDDHQDVVGVARSTAHPGFS